MGGPGDSDGARREAPGGLGEPAGRAAAGCGCDSSAGAFTEGEGAQAEAGSWGSESECLSLSLRLSRAGGLRPLRRKGGSFKLASGCPPVTTE
jgi:hypothetical protein